MGSRAMLDQGCGPDCRLTGPRNARRSYEWVAEALDQDGTHFLIIKDSVLTARGCRCSQFRRRDHNHRRAQCSRSVGLPLCVQLLQHSHS